MRLWHKDLIKVLPRQQLISQWRECCCIAKKIHDKGNPNNILVNKIMDYDDKHFNIYARKVYYEMLERGYDCNWYKFIIWRNHQEYNGGLKQVFPNWHNDRYLKQCYYNLQEKYDCGGISEEEWERIKDQYEQI